MPNVIREIQVDELPEKVWAVLANIGAVQDYSPGILKSFLTSEIMEGIGCSRHCDLFPTGTVEERIVDWHEGDQYSIEIYKGKEVPYTGIAHFSLKRNGHGTNVTQIMDYKQTADQPQSSKSESIEKLVGKIIKGNLLGLKHFTETGEIVTYEVYKRIRKSGKT